MKWLSHPLVIGFFSLAAIGFIVSLRHSVTTFAGSGQHVAQLREQVEQLESQTDSLLHQLQTANTPLAQEKMIRNQLLMKKEGEYVVQLVDDPRLKKPEQAVVPTQSPLEAWKELVW